MFKKKLVEKDQFRREIQVFICNAIRRTPIDIPGFALALHTRSPLLPPRPLLPATTPHTVIHPRPLLFPLHTPNHRGREVHLALISSLDVRSDAGIDLWHVFQGAAHCYVARQCYSYATFGSRTYTFACICPSAWFADAGLHHGPSP